MKTKRTLLAGALFVCALIFYGFAVQDNPLAKLIAQLEQYLDKNTQEKVYLHTDKPFYAVGDDIWFKAYVVDAQTLTPSPKSNILYVDLIDARDSIRKTLRVPLFAGLGLGNIELKDSLVEGNYRLRAYTRWMRNFDQAYFFDRTLKIGNIWTDQLVTKASSVYQKNGDKQETTTTINFSNLDGYAYADKEVNYQVTVAGKLLSRGRTKTDDKGNISLSYSNNKTFLGGDGAIQTSITLAENTVINRRIAVVDEAGNTDLQFFPEGGDLVENVRSKVAFKSLGADGLGKAVSGFVQDDAGNKVALIKDKHLGMGYFAFAPMAGKSYQAIVKFEDGAERTFKLPPAKPEGITLALINPTEDKIGIRVAANQSFLAKNQGKTFCIVGQNSGNVVYTAKAKLNNLSFGAELERSRFIQGINQITLLDENMLPVAERLLFIAPKDTLSIKLQANKANYRQREKTSITVKATKPDGKPVIGSFSMAVIDPSKMDLQPDKEDHILSNLLLTSDIKGYVEQPAYYFNHPDQQVLANADILMMTQGWRRFSWQNLNATALSYKPEKTISLSGKVTQGKDKPVANGAVTVFAKSDKILILQTKTDSNGEFMIDSLTFPDSTTFLVQARTEKGRKNVDIEIYDSTVPVVTANPNRADLTVNINESMQAYLQNSKSQYEAWLKSGLVNRSVLLKEVVVVDRKPPVKNSSNLNGAGNADKVFTAKDLESSYSLEQALIGRVAGLTFSNGIAYIRGQQAQIVMDGFYMDADFLNSIPVSDVESVEILKNIAYTAIYGSRGGGGVIVINTKRGESNYTRDIYVPGVKTIRPIGLVPAKEFYVPNYADPKINPNVPDLRTTVYWNPNIVTDSLGNATVSFYNGDNPGKYRVTLEGMDLSGHLARKVMYYNLNAKSK